MEPKAIFTVLFASITLAAPPATADTLTIAAASDLKFAMTEIVSNFKAIHPVDRIEVIYGSSGQMCTQILQGAPYDLFFSADKVYPQQLIAEGAAQAPLHPYAVGRIVLWSATVDASRLKLSDLAGIAFKRVAIANPKHAPYGQKAEQALRSTGVWSQVEPKLVFGENIAQTAQFVATRNADVGVIALSLALSPEFAAKGKYALIPDSLHGPLDQAFAVTRRARSNKLAQLFATFMEQSAARRVMLKYGFALPGELDTNLESDKK